MFGSVLYVFGSCFRTLAIILVSDFSSFSKKHLNLTALHSLLETTHHLSAYARMGDEEDNDDADAD